MGAEEGVVTGVSMAHPEEACEGGSAVLSHAASGALGRKVADACRTLRGLCVLAPA